MEFKKFIKEPFYFTKKFIVNKLRIQDKSLALVVKGNSKFPDGAVVRVMTYNTPELECHVTTCLNPSPASWSNPVVAENEETGLVITHEEFHEGEFIPHNELVKLPAKQSKLS